MKWLCIIIKWLLLFHVNMSSYFRILNMYSKTYSKSLIYPEIGERKNPRNLSSVARRRRSTNRCRLFRELSYQFSTRIMICIRKRYFNLNRLLLLPLGLWPDKQTKFTRFWAGLLFSILASFILFQVIFGVITIISIIFSVIS